MSDKRITRTQASKDSNLQKEVDEFNPFTPRKELPRGEDEHFLNLSRSSSKDTEPLNDTSESIQENYSFENPFDISVLSNNSTKTLVDLGDSHLNYSLEKSPKIEIKMSMSEKSVSGRPSSSEQPYQNINVYQQPVTIQVVTVRDALMVVPEFNGRDIPLAQFIEGSEINLVKLLRSKITDEARQAISGQVFLTIDELKTFLKNIYAPSTNIPQLLGELGPEFQKDHENVITYANRIRDIGTRILEARSIENRGLIGPNFRAPKENTLIDSFKKGLKFELEQRLENKEVEDVNNLTKNAITIERKLEAQKTK